MVKVNRLYNRIEPFSALFSALGIVFAHMPYTAIGDPARQPGIPQPWYWHDTVRQGLRLINRDRPTKTAQLRCWSTFFQVAALIMRISRVGKGGWGGIISVDEKLSKRV